MHVEDAIDGYLSGYAGLTALVSDRIYPLIRPNGDTLPGITYQLVREVDDNCLSEDPGTVKARFRFDCFGSTYASVLNVAEQVRLAFRDFSGIMGGAGGVQVNAVLQVAAADSYDSGTTTYYRKLKFEFHYQE